MPPNCHGQPFNIWFKEELSQWESRSLEKAWKQVGWQPADRLVFLCLVGSMCQWLYSSKNYIFTRSVFFASILHLLLLLSTLFSHYVRFKLKNALHSVPQMPSDFLTWVDSQIHLLTCFSFSNPPYQDLYHPPPFTDICQIIN